MTDRAIIASAAGLLFDGMVGPKPSWGRRHKPKPPPPQHPTSKRAKVKAAR